MKGAGAVLFAIVAFIFLLEGEPSIWDSARVWAAKQAGIYEPPTPTREDAE